MSQDGPDQDKTRDAAAGAALPEKAFGQYSLELHRYLLRRLAVPQDADDLAQEIYLRLLRRKKDESVLNPRAYLYRIASHVVSEFRARSEQAQDYVTFDSQTVERLGERASEGWTADDLADRLNAQRELERALAELPPTHQAVFLLHKRDGLSHQEIAAELQLSLHTIEKYLIQAKARLRAMAWDR